MNEKLVALKKTVSKHKTTIAVVATALTCYAIQRQTVRDWNGFLRENDLYDAYYFPTED
jgi:hypothetical protein